MKKLIRTSTIAMSLDLLLKGQLAYLNQYFEVVAVSGRDSHLDAVAEREGVRTVGVAMSRSISPLQDLVSLVKLYLLFKRERPYIVHSITPKAGLLSMTAAYFAGVPVRIHTFTGLIFPSKTGVMKQVLIMMDKLLCRFATLIIPEGQGVKNDLIHYDITSKPLTLIANGNVNGVDVAYFNRDVISDSTQTALKNQLGILSTDFVYVFVGRLVRDKGINELISAFVTLASQRASVKLLLVGPYESDLDPLTPETMELIANHDSILSVGFQHDIRPYLAISDCLVFPSYREGFPNVVLQAGAMGLPCIVTDINGSNEIITDGINGLVIPPKSVSALLEAMELLESDLSFYNALKAQSRTRIVSFFEQKIVWEALLDRYQKTN